MKLATACSAAFAVGALLVAPPTSRAADVIKLGGVGSLSAPAAAVDAPTLTLQGDPNGDADTTDVIYRPYLRGYAHGAAGLPYRPYLGYWRPLWWARPFYWASRPYWGFYRPFYGYRPGFAIGLNYYAGLYPSYSSTTVVATAPPMIAAPPVISSYPPAAIYSAPAVVPSDTLPMPTPNGTYQYDGGPANPVPMPPRIPAPPATVEPPPATTPAPPPGTTVPSVSRVKITVTARPKLTYPAYGEDQPARPAKVNPLLVKSPGS